MDERKKLGLMPCITIIVGGCIGSAIFSLSGMTMYYAGPAAILSWIIAGIILCCYGMQVAELSVRYPKSGGIYVFPKRAFGHTSKTRGEFWGFISAWGYIVSNIIAVAFSAIYVAVYLGAGFPALNHQVLLAIISVVVCLVLNVLSITATGKVNNIIVAALAITMIIYAVVSIFGGSFDASLFTPFLTQGLKGSTGWISAIPVASVAYGSCVAIAFMVSEVKNPNRTVPKSLLIGIAAVIVLYLLMIIGTLGNLNVGILMDDENAFFRYVPMFAALWTGQLGALHPWLAQLISISALLALITTMLVVMALCARTIQAVSEDGYLPKGLAKNNRNGVPARATLVVAVISALLSLKPEWTEILVSLGALLAVIAIVITCSALIKARSIEPAKPGDYRAPLGNFLSFVTIALLVLCYVPDIIGGNWMMWAFTAIIYVVGIVIFAARRGHAAA